MQQSTTPMMQSSEMGALKLRKTFIELAQPAPGDEAAMLLTSEEVTSSRFRSSSEPATRRSIESAEVFSDDRAYVRNLDAVLQTVWASSPFGGRLVDSGVAAPHNSFCTSSGEQTQSPRQPQTMMEQPSPMENDSLEQEQLRASRPSNTGKWSAAAISQEEAAVVAGSSDSTRVATRESSSDGAATTSESASMTSGALSSVLWRGGLNDGSVGHPGLCARPCLFFEAGQCANGTSCEFCHLPHERREVVQAKRNKKRWDALKQMRPRKAAALILPILKEKILSFDDSEATELAVDRLVAACGFASAAGGEMALQPRSSGGAALARALHESGLRTLVVTLERTALKEQPEAQEAAEALLRQLRVVCRQRGVLTSEAQWDSDDV